MKGLADSPIIICFLFMTILSYIVLIPQDVIGLKRLNAQFKDKTTPTYAPFLGRKLALSLSITFPVHILSFIFTAVFYCRQDAADKWEVIFGTLHICKAATMFPVVNLVWLFAGVLLIFECVYRVMGKSPRH